MKKLKLFFILLILCISVYYAIFYTNTQKDIISNDIYLDYNQLLDMQTAESNIISKLQEKINIKYITPDNAIYDIQFYILPNKLDNITYHTISYKELNLKLYQPYQSLPLDSTISINLSFSEMPKLTLLQESLNTIAYKTLYSRDSTYYIPINDSNKNTYILKCLWPNNNSIDIIIYVNVLT